MPAITEFTRHYPSTARRTQWLGDQSRSDLMFAGIIELAIRVGWLSSHLKCVRPARSGASGKIAGWFRHLAGKAAQLNSHSNTSASCPFVANTAFA